MCGADSQSCILIFGAVSQWNCRASSALSSVGDGYNMLLSTIIAAFTEKQQSSEWKFLTQGLKF